MGRSAFFSLLLMPFPIANLLGSLAVFCDLLKDNGSVSQMIHGDQISRHKVQAISYGKRKLNPAVIINIGNQFITNCIP